MKAVITGTSTEVTWPQTTQMGAMSFLLGIQVQAEISPASYPYKPAIQGNPLGSPTCPTCSDAGSLTFPKPLPVKAEQALLQPKYQSIFRWHPRTWRSPRTTSSLSTMRQQVAIRAGQSHRSSGKCLRYLETTGAGEVFRSLEHKLLKVTALGKRLALASSTDPMQPPHKLCLAHYFNQGPLIYLLCERQLRKSSLALFCLRQKQPLFSKLLLTALSH